MSVLTDVEIHDTVLIAAAFCTFNRYVDGLGALTPSDAAGYLQRARPSRTRSRRDPAAAADAIVMPIGSWWLGVVGSWALGVGN